MESKLVCVADFLSYEEGIILYNRLQEAGISALVKSCGPPSIPFAEGLFYQLLVSEESLAAATEISAKFQVELKNAKVIIRCPRCRSEAVFKAENLPFWQKLYYVGTEVFKCQDCAKTFSR